MSKLFDEDSDDGEVNFGTNKDYAKSYNKLRQKELLKKLKDREGSDDSGSSSDSDSSEDDEAAINPKFDQEFFKTLSSLKRKDPTIYDQQTKFFEEELEADAGVASKKAEKAITIKKYETDILLKKGGIYDEDEENEAGERSQSPTYNEEQKMIKDELKNALNDSDNEDGEGNDWGGLFKKRQQTKEEQEKDDEQQAKWLEEHEELKEKSAGEIWSKALSKDEKFLRDYILSNAYADKDVEEIPTYDEIVADDDFEDKQTEFEHKYNFRFEDPDQDFIKRYPRTIANSVRKVDTRRKEKRVEVRERKEREKQEKFQEIEMLKELKRKEIEEKMEKLKAVTGTDELNIEEIDLDGDFDPEEYDKKMQAIFNSEYYQVDEGDDKPECPSDIEDLKVENYDEYEPEHDGNEDDIHCEDEDFNMDCDYDPVAAAEQQKKSFQDELIDSTRDKRKRRKRKSKFMEMLESKKPAFNPEDHKSYSEYLDEYYKLDCEDIVGDVKCRFKYVETTPCDYGLSVEEILMAKNKELNAWASMKKVTQIRQDHVERNDQAIFERKARNEAIKRKILQSLYELSDEEEMEVETVKNPTVIIGNSGENKTNNNDQPTVGDKKKKKKNQKQPDKSEPAPSTSGLQDVKQSARKVNDMVETKLLVEVPAPSTEKEQPKTEEKSTKPSETPAKIKSNEQPTKDKQKPPNAPKFEKNNAIKKFNEKQKNPKFKKVLNKTIDKNAKKSNALSDERLKAFGINPKKFHKKQKYGVKSDNNQQNTSAGGNKNNKGKPGGPQANKKPNNQAIKNKLKKALSKK